MVGVIYIDPNNESPIISYIHTQAPPWFLPRIWPSSGGFFYKWVANTHFVT